MIPKTLLFAKALQKSVPRLIFQFTEYLIKTNIDQSMRKLLVSEDLV